MRTMSKIGLAGGLAVAALAAHEMASLPRGGGQTAALGNNIAAALAPNSIKNLDRIGGLADHGVFAEYGSEAPVRRGAHVLYPVRLSEEHALRSIETGHMLLRSPKGKAIDLKYLRKIEHPDGNWTWVGHPAGSPSGVQAMITFGDKAVFGTIPQSNGLPLEIASAKGRAMMIETDARLLPQRGPERIADTMVIPSLAGSSPEFSRSPVVKSAPSAQGAGSPRVAAAAAPQVGTASAATAAAAPTPTNMTVSPIHTIDLVVGYTAHFADRLGGTSEAVTRVTFLVDLANQTLANSQAGGHIRLMQAVQVDYPDATSNRTTLTELTGVTCVNANGPTRTEFPDNSVTCTRGSVATPLQPLVTARERYGADLVSLVRTFEDPENQSCGIAWMLGGGQLALDAANADFGYSVVSDSSASMFPDPDTNNTCRSETLAHELGHGLGLQHELEVAQGSTDQDGDGSLLDAEEYGRYGYSFGYRELADAGNFYTVMAQRFTGGNAFLVFSNPRITFCGGMPCGTPTADNARTIAQTLPMVAAFRQPVAAVAGAWRRGDFNGDGMDDILWRNLGTGTNVIWRSGNSASPQSVTAAPNLSWIAVGSGDFDGDSSSDILWRNNLTGQNVIWRAGMASQPLAVATVASQQWYVAGVGDFDGDARSDILWRNSLSGANSLWRSGDVTTSIAIGPVSDASWNIVGTGDFNGDGKDDILWRNSSSGANLIWRSGVSSQTTSVASASLQWFVAAVADFDGDGRDDILWRDSTAGRNAIWKSASSATPVSVATVPNLAWMVAGVGDFDQDGKADILWRQGRTGQNVIWRSGNSSTPLAVGSVTNLSWVVSG